MCQGQGLTKTRGGGHSVQLRRDVFTLISCFVKCIRQYCISWYDFVVSSYFDLSLLKCYPVK